MSATSFQLEDLLRPVVPETFFRDTWEKAPLVVARGDEGHYAGLLSLRDVDQIVAFSRPKFTDPSAFQSRGTARPTYVRGMLDQPSFSPKDNPGVAELRQVFDHGKSVVIMAMQHRWPAVAELCRNLETVLHCPVHANLYLTPAGSQGFAAHYDTHEVFILQLEGVKHWRLYGAVESLPLVSESVVPPRLPLGTAQEVCLQAGDFLYIPRGHVHEAFTADTASLHLTVGISVYRWADLLHHALVCASHRDRRLRESIPGGGLPGSKSEVKLHFKLLLAELADSESGDALFDEAARALGDQFFGQLHMLPGNQFTSLSDRDGLDIDTVLEKHPLTLCRVVNDEHGAAIEFPGNRVSGPHRIASALHFVAQTARFAVRELPDDLNAEGKVVLARRLLREGLLRIVSQPPSVKRPADSQIANAGDGEAVTTAPTSDWEAIEAAQQVQQFEAIVES
jgi:ribosomal protein L16 Arg81 hydroxylase